MPDAAPRHVFSRSYRQRAPPSSAAPPAFWRPRSAGCRGILRPSTLGLLGRLPPGHRCTPPPLASEHFARGVAPASPAVTAANLASAVLTNSGFRPPSWLALAEGARPPLTNCHRVFGDFARGWQRAATAPVDREALETLFSDISPASRALLLSQAGPGGSTVLTTLPTRPEYAMHDDAFRVTLLRRLRLPLPPTARVCRCGGELDILGDHRAACATAGVLVRRAVPVERTVAQICREAGGRVATDVFLRDLHLGLPITDARRLEVVANRPPLLPWRASCRRRHVG